ncbi:MAG: formyl transferase [Prevotellaceae bacterium]|jgi:methionyl-tRNA formyltransferase|nr:formyl transferase [Prevotellaceae bacterium]
MKIEILGNPNTHAYGLAHDSVIKLGHKIVNRAELVPDIAVAPLLTDRLSKEELLHPVFGTLIFHPSPLPYGRGASAIRWAYRRQEPITAATWFWANGRLDAGDICEQEIIKIDYGLSPRAFYERDILPAMVRTLERALKSISSGHQRKIPQIEQYATYDSIIK